MELVTKSQIAPQKDVMEISNESVYGTHLRMLLKMDLMVQIDAKSDQLKNESKSEIFSVPVDAQESANETIINAFEVVSLIVQYWVQLIMPLELHLKVPFTIYIKLDKKVHLLLH